MSKAANQGGPARWLVRGESIVASTGLALAAIVLLAMASAGAWTVYAERRAAQDRAAQDLQSWGLLLARSLEQQLGAGGLSGARTLVINAAAEHDLSGCRVLLPDGRTLVDAQPKENTIKQLPKEWPTGAPVAAGLERSPGAMKFTVPLEIAGSGQASLEIGTRIHYSRLASWEGETGLGVIGACGAIAVLLVYRRLRSRLRALGAIREALLAMERGETAGAALAVNAAFGAEAGAWNGLLLEREQLRQDLMSERARESLAGKRDQRADLAQACDALWQGMVLLDEHLTVKYANGAAASFLRGKREAMIGSSVEEHVKDEHVLASLRGLGSGSSRRRASFEVRRAEADGGGILRFSVRPVRREDSAAALLMIEDVTQQRVADEARNAFVAQATHELRTPLTNIRLYVEQAIEASEDKAVRTRALDVINQESRRLERIIGDMLSVSEIEAGSFKLRSGDVRLENLFEDLRSEYEPQARSKNLALTLQLPPKLPVIKGDRDKIVLALHNLIGNAVKYTPEGGKVDVKVDADDQRLQVDVADTGIGIKPEETELIFEKFYRAKDRRVESITGTGLGLALAREVVRLHGGDISVRSQLDQGSTFTMTLPVRAEAA
jgi:signal transduction histidine kinase